MKKNILVIGYGNMGAPVAQAIASTFLDFEMTIINPSVPRNSLPEKAKYYSLVNQLPKDEKYDVIILALKPQVAKAGLLSQYSNHIKKEGTIISLMAGVKISTIQEYFKDKSNIKIVRAMPNICAKIGKSLTGVAVAENDFSAAEFDFVEQLIGSFGEVVRVKEDKINAITAVAGSGPAYVLYALESTVRALVKYCDLTEEMAVKFVLNINIKGVHLSSHQINKVQMALKEIEGKGSVETLIANTLKSVGKEAKDILLMTVDGIMSKVSLSLIEAAKSVAGFNDEDATKLVRSTVIGTVQLAKQSDKSLRELKESVISVGGTTEAGLGKWAVACGRAMNEIAKETIAAALNRANEL